MIEKYKELIDKINEDGIGEACESFGFVRYSYGINLVPDEDRIYNILNKHKLWEYINLINIEDDYIDYVLYQVSFYNEKKVIDFVYNTLSDVIQLGNDYYFDINNMTDLAELYKDSGRNTSPYDIATSVFDGQDYYDYNYSDGINYMEDVYNSLTPINKKYLRDKIVDEYGDKEIIVEERYVTDVIEKISEINEDDEYVFKISNENIMDLFSCDDTMNYLFISHLNEIQYALEDLYNSAYRDAMDYQNYKDVYKELCGSYIDSDNCEDYYDEKTKKNIFRFKYNEVLSGKRNVIRLKITNTLPKIIINYVKYNNCDPITNLGSYEYVLREGMSCGVFEKLSFRVSDYPGLYELEEIMNSTFMEYF